MGGVTKESSPMVNALSSMAGIMAASTGQFTSIQGLVLT